MAVKRKFTKPVRIGMILSGRDNHGNLGFRRVEVMGKHPDGRWMIRDRPSRLRPSPSSIWTPCPEFNLRVVFEIEQEPEYTQPEGALVKLMREIDKHEDLDEHPIRKSAAYEQAVVELGWNIDWDRMAEERLGQ